MSADVGSLPPVPAGAPLSWSQAWLLAITRPSVATFESIARDPRATANRAYGWIFVSTLLTYAIVLLGQWVLSALRGGASPGPLAADGLVGSTLIFLVCGAPLGAVFAVVGLMISAGLSQLIAGALGGAGSYARLAYVIAAYLAPLTLISSVIGFFPLANCLLFPLGIYALVLNVIAVKAVNQFGWGKAVVSSAVVLVGVLIVVAVFVIVILALLGPAIGNVFSNIIQEMGTPVP
jgi:Yip1-like protein